MRWKAILARLICWHTKLEKIATFEVFSNSGGKVYKPIKKVITTYECQQCGRLIDK